MKPSASPKGEFDWHQREVTIGSSRGGAVAMNINSGLPASALIAIGHEHRLADPESMRKMLETVEKAAVQGQ